MADPDQDDQMGVSSSSSSSSSSTSQVLFSFLLGELVGCVGCVGVGVGVGCVHILFFLTSPQSLREALQGHDIPENVILILKEHQISFNDLKQGLITKGDFQEMEIAIGPKRRLLALHSTPDPAPGLLFLLFLLLFVIV